MYRKSYFLRSDVHSYLISALGKYEKTIVHMLLELRQYSDLSRHIKEPQNCIYCLILKKRPCFIPEVTYSVFSVGAL